MEFVRCDILISNFEYVAVYSVYTCGAQSHTEAVSYSATGFLPKHHSTNVPYSSLLKFVDSLWATVLTVWLNKTLEVINISYLYLSLY
jgi:hypothetical protein